MKKTLTKLFRRFVSRQEIAKELNIEKARVIELKTANELLIDEAIRLNDEVDRERGRKLYAQKNLHDLMCRIEDEEKAVLRVSAGLRMRDVDLVEELAADNKKISTDLKAIKADIVMLIKDNNEKDIN